MVNSYKSVLSALTAALYRGTAGAKQQNMKRNRHKPCGARRATLADLVAIVNHLTHNERLTAYIVADLINSHRVSLEGQFQGRRVVVA
jgi:hypothetical protein